MNEERRIEAADPPANALAAPRPATPATGVVVVSRPRRGPRSNRARLAIIGVLVGLLVLCMSVVAVRDLRALAGEQGRPGRVVDAYIHAVQVHEWAEAQGYLSAPLRGRPPRWHYGTPGRRASGPTAP